jgi:hypothetical protein
VNIKYVGVDNSTRVGLWIFGARDSKQESSVLEPEELTVGEAPKPSTEHPRWGLARRWDEACLLASMAGEQCDQICFGKNCSQNTRSYLALLVFFARNNLKQFKSRRKRMFKIKYFLINSSFFPKGAISPNVVALPARQKFCLSCRLTRNPLATKVKGSTFWNYFRLATRVARWYTFKQKIPTG